uniref:U-box domain-containing protein n=1 Tax=viral metagenome TaxID=1070528 RepID=A0A6C0B5F9_9ZZZZ
MYSKIVNPGNGNVLKIGSTQGLEILRNYLNVLNKISIKQEGGSSTAEDEEEEKVEIPFGISTGEEFIAVLVDGSHVKMTAEGNAGDIMVLTPVKKMQLKAEAEAAEAFAAFVAAVADAPTFVKCAITDEVMYDPVINALGYTYERKEIENWYIINNSDPLTGGPISDLTLRPNMFARQIIELWCKHNVRDGGDSYFTYAVDIRKKNDQTFGSLKEGECVRELQLVREQLATCEAESRTVVAVETPLINTFTYT